jgi:surfactin synthase thioesterase subunit
MTGVDEERSLWTRRFHPSPEARARLVCLPHAGGSASYFFPVSAKLEPEIEVLAIQYPGRQDRRADPCIEDLMQLADQVAEALSPWTDLPLALFGHSMGALLGYEVALRLEQTQNVVPVALFASGRRAPSTHRLESVHRRSNDGIAAEMHYLSGTNTQLLGDEEFMRLVLPMIRSDYKAVETYTHVPGQRLTCPIHAIVGDRDPKTTLEEAGAWSEHTTGQFDLHVYEGGHFYLNDWQGEILEQICDCLLPA